MHLERQTDRRTDQSKRAQSHDEKCGFENGNSQHNPCGGEARHS